MFELSNHARMTQAETQYNPTICEHVDLLRLSTNRTSVFADRPFKDLSTPSATRQSNRHSQYCVEGPQSGSKSRLSLTLTSSPSLNTCNAAGAACAEAASPSSQLEPTPTARRPPSGLNASADTPTGNFGYCFSRFLDVWSQTDTVPSEPPEANVLYLERLKKQTMNKHPDLQVLVDCAAGCFGKCGMLTWGGTQWRSRPTHGQHSRPSPGGT
jgi:hypothetical protein